MRSASPNPRSVRRFALEVRSFLDDYWSGLRANSRNRCIETSIFLIPLLKARFGGSWEVASGRYTPPGTRRRLSHCWAREKMSGLQVDLTGDQFWLETVIVCRDEKSPYKTVGALQRVFWKLWKKDVTRLEDAYRSRQRAA